MAYYDTQHTISAINFTPECDFQKTINEIKELIPKEINVNDRVVLLAGKYSQSLRNPCIDSKYECVGTIIERRDWFLKVKWDNGKSNVYDKNEKQLVIANDTIKTKRLGCKSIW